MRYSAQTSAYEIIGCRRPERDMEGLRTTFLYKG